MDLVEDIAEPVVPIATACQALGVSRATLYRNTRPAPPRCVAQRAPSPRRVSDAERTEILDTFRGHLVYAASAPSCKSASVSFGVL